MNSWSNIFLSIIDSHIYIHKSQIAWKRVTVLSLFGVTSTNKETGHIYTQTGVGAYSANV